MAASDDLQKYHCFCRATILRASQQGIELHCDRCRRRHMLPFTALKNKQTLDRYWRDLHAREKRI